MYLLQGVGLNRAAIPALKRHDANITSRTEFKRSRECRPEGAGNDYLLTRPDGATCPLRGGRREQQGRRRSGDSGFSRFGEKSATIFRDLLVRLG
jgi:hypothetical protein